MGLEWMGLEQRHKNASDASTFGLGPPAMCRGVGMAYERVCGVDGVGVCGMALEWRQISYLLQPHLL